VAAKLEKAYIEFLEPAKSGPGGAVSVAGQTRVTCKFNPKEYSIQKSADWNRSNTKGAAQTSVPEFTGSQPRSLSLELFLDATDSPSGDVSADVEALFGCLVPLPSTLSKQKPSPPFVRFGWGDKVLFTAFLKTVNAKYTLFRPDGTPMRASCAVTLEEIPADAAKQNPTSGGLATRGGHTVVAGDSLASIAYREYGTPAYWRALAEANGIDDPLRLRPGTRLLVPPAEEVVGHG
jgi:nucleoid-associated protein YgaU